MPIRFLFRLCWFASYSCAWHSLFSVSMSAQGVPCVPILLVPACFIGSFLQFCRGYILSPPWQSTDSKYSLNHSLFPCRFCFFLLGAISVVRSGLLQIRCHMHVECIWLARSLTRDHDNFSLTSAATRRSLIVIAPLSPKPLIAQGRPNQTAGF